MSITKFPKFNLYNVPEGLRKLADDIESGRRKAERVVIAMELENGQPDYCTFGPNFFWMNALGIMRGVEHLIVKDQLHEYS